MFIDPKNTFVSLAAMVVLSCEAIGAASYNWERQSGRIPSGAIGMNTNTLTLVNLQLNDIDKYRCVATNSSGTNVSKFAELKINSKAIQYTGCFCTVIYVVVCQWLHFDL